MVKEFSCEHCGHKIESFPPDDIHTEFLMSKTKEECIKTTYKCEDCHADIVRYWCTKEPHVFVGEPIKGPKNPFGDY